jgi:hypothetical protein
MKEFYHDGAIFTMEGALSKCECDEILQIKGKTPPRHNDYDNTREYDIDLPDDQADKLQAVFEGYLKHNNIPNLYTYSSNSVQYTRGDIHLHTDLEQYHDQTHLRHFSVLVSLNGDDIEGGNLILPRQGIIITPKTGMLIIFPIGVFFPHQVEPCFTDVRRYMLRPFWHMNPNHPDYEYLHSRPAKEEK